MIEVSELYNRRCIYGELFAEVESESKQCRNIPRGQLQQLMQRPSRRFLINIPNTTHSPGERGPCLSTDRLNSGANRSFPGVRTLDPRPRNSSSQGRGEREAEGGGRSVQVKLLLAVKEAARK